MPNAPLAELRLAVLVRWYERVKLALLVIVLVVNLVIGGYVLGISTTNKATLAAQKESLVILRCAVDKTVQVDENGHPRTQEQAREAFTACIERAQSGQS